MNCHRIQNQILALARPAELTGDTAEHLTVCESCQTWHRLLIQVEHAAGRMPIPKNVGNGKEKLLKQFKSEKTDAKSARPKKSDSSVAKTIMPAKSGNRKSLGDRLARFWPIGILSGAACFMILIVSQSGRKPVLDTQAYAADPMLERVVTAKVQLDRSANAPERLKVLAKLADDVQEQSKSLYLLNLKDDMASLSRMYEEIVMQGIIGQAESLDANERRQLLGKYTEMLAQAEQKATRMAAEAPVDSVEALREMASTARLGKNQLAKLREKLS